MTKIARSLKCSRSLRLFQKIECLFEKSHQLFKLLKVANVIHTDFREDIPEIILDKSKFCMYSLFLTLVDVCNRDIDLELKYNPSRNYLVIEYSSQVKSIQVKVSERPRHLLSNDSGVKEDLRKIILTTTC